MKKFLPLIVCLMIMMIYIPVRADNMPDCKTELVANYTTVAAGEQLKVSLAFNNAASYPYGLAAFCATVSYDESKLKLEKIECATSAQNVNTAKDNDKGMFKVLYCFASAKHTPGFNKNGAFATATFTVLETAASGKTSISADFDSITVSTYKSSTVTNHQVKFNKPKTSVKINNPAVPETSSSSSSGGTSSASSKAASSVSSAPGKGTASSATAGNASTPAKSVENPKYKGVTGDVVTTDYYGGNSNETASVSSNENSNVVLPSSQVQEGTNSGDEDIDSTVITASTPMAVETADKDSAVTTVTIIIAIVVIAAAAIVTVILLMKRKADKLGKPGQNKKPNKK